VATISDLWMYPIKGCRGFPVREATLAATGLEVEGIGDREWVVVDGDGEFLSQREHPKLALVETRMTVSSLRVKAPGMLTLEVPFASEGDVVKVRVWDDSVAAVTQGEVADAWFSSYLGKPARLMRFDPEHTRLSSHRYTGALDAPYKFADAFALLIAGTESLADLDTRLSKAGHAAVTMDRFRPNVVLSGLDAYGEDYIKRLQVREMQLRVVKRGVRCRARPARHLSRQGRRRDVRRERRRRAGFWRHAACWRRGRDHARLLVSRPMSFEAVPRACRVVAHDNGDSRHCCLETYGLGH
jgi:uncharacterized protein YcbX